ncbi:MAG: DNA replication/repair protein RecF [Firmicutes bacterium]|nr:DNA replication/repair protein RecF [Bacillota bacterium]
MYLEKIGVNNFRNYALAGIEPGPNLNVIYGENAQGKTNLLEAIYFIFSAISHRTRKDKELIRWNSDFFKIQGEVHLGDGPRSLQIDYHRLKGKTIKINYHQMTVDQYFSHFPVVIFYPQDIFLLTGGPAVRRRFLNTEITRLYPHYYHQLIKYYRILAQRNNILKSGVFYHDDSPDTWGEFLADCGSRIIRERIKYLGRMEKYASRFQGYFTGGKEDIKLEYKSKVNINGLTGDGGNKGIHEIKNNFLEALERRKEEELKRGYTLVGPHVDDMSVLLNNREIKKASSQGQQRTTIISLKMAQASMLKEEKKEEPLLLMDDCFSELDRRRSYQVLEMIEENKIQCFITSYERLDLPGKMETLFFRIDKGNISCG